MITDTLTTLYQNLQALDGAIKEGEAHLRVMKDADFPGVMALEDSLRKTLVKRANTLKAIETEMARPQD